MYRCGLLLQMSHVAWSASLCVGYADELCKNGWTDRDVVCRADSRGSKEPCIRWGSRSPYEKGPPAGVTEWRCGLLSNYFAHLAIVSYRITKTMIGMQGMIKVKVIMPSLEVAPTTIARSTRQPKSRGNVHLSEKGTFHLWLCTTTFKTLELVLTEKPSYQI